MMSVKMWNTTIAMIGIVVGFKIIKLLELPLTWIPSFYAVVNGF